MGDPTRKGIHALSAMRLIRKDATVGVSDYMGFVEQRRPAVAM